MSTMQGLCRYLPIPAATCCYLVPAATCCYLLLPAAMTYTSNMPEGHLVVNLSCNTFTPRVCMWLAYEISIHTPVTVCHNGYYCTRYQNYAYRYQYGSADAMTNDHDRKRASRSRASSWVARWTAECFVAPVAVSESCVLTLFVLPSIGVSIKV